MELRQIDIGSVMEVRDAVAVLANHEFSVFDRLGRLIVSAPSEDPLSVIARDEYADFVKTCIGKAILRKGVSMFKGPMGQYQCFIPAQVGDAWLVFVGESFYTSPQEMDEFFVKKASQYGLSRQELTSWAKRMVYTDLRSVSETCGAVHRLFGLIVRDNYEKNVTKDRYRRVRTMIDLFSDVQDMTEEKVYGILCDTAIFLFGGDTVAVLPKDHDTFVPSLTTGRAKEAVEGISLKSDSFLVAEMIRNRKPVVCSEMMELLRFGYPDEVASVVLFPLLMRGEVSGLLTIFNTQLSDEDIDSISKLCGFVGFMLENILSQKTYRKQVRDLAAIDIASLNLTTFKDPDRLYEAIIDMSSKYMNAEKASLMLPENGNEVLSVRAVKGINKWIAKNITVKAGEGIAGRVFQEGTPLMVSDIEKALAARKRPNYRTTSFISLPLKIGTKTIGVLNLADKLSGEVFSEADLEFLRYFASYASIAIQGAHYYQMSEQMRTLSVTDSLTGLFNRRYFDERLFEELQRASRYESRFSLAIFDIDDFKLFNDTEGHVAGDEVLKTIANVSRESLRSIDILARIGGEEFAIIMPQTDVDEALLVAERVRNNSKDFMTVSWKNFPKERITVSIGIACFPVDGKDAKTLIRSADKALYRAKVSGKDRTIVGDTPNVRFQEAPFHGAF